MTETRTEYELKKCKKQTDAEAKPIKPEDVLGLVKSINGQYVLWMHYGVLADATSKFESKNYDLKFLVRLRVFDANEEWHIWRTAAGLMGRHRNDEAVENGLEEQPFVDTDMKVRGVIAKQMPNSNDSETWYVKTRNYIDYNEIGQAGYVDSRFLIIDKK